MNLGAVPKIIKHWKLRDIKKLEKEKKGHLERNKERRKRKKKKKKKKED